MRGEISHSTNSFQTELRLAKHACKVCMTQVFTLDVCYSPKFIVFEYNIFPKTIRYGLRCSRLCPDRLCPDLRAVLLLQHLPVQNEQLRLVVNLLISFRIVPPTELG